MPKITIELSTNDLKEYLADKYNYDDKCYDMVLRFFEGYYLLGEYKQKDLATEWKIIKIE